MNMTTNITLEASRVTQLQPFCYPEFYLIVSPQIEKYLDLSAGQYERCTKLVMRPSDDLAEFLNKNTPEGCDIVLLIPDGYALGYENPHASLPESSLKKRRMVVLRCLSTPSTFKDIQLMVESLYDIPMEKQTQMIDRLYALGGNVPSLMIRDSKGKVSAQFNHLSDVYTWHSLYGTPTPGQFVLAPSGETNVVVTKMAEQGESQVSLDINGTLILQGIPIVHYGVKPNLYEKQKEIYNALHSLRVAPVEAMVEAGKIVKVKALDPLSKPAEKMLEHLFEEEEIYRYILELGFGLNEDLQVSDDNLGTNEFYGGQGGCIHYGLGRIPQTTFHIDIVCPDAQLLTSKGDLIFGPDMGNLRKAQLKHAAA
jgi:hypothetical protein